MTITSGAGPDSPADRVTLICVAEGAVCWWVGYDDLAAGEWEQAKAEMRAHHADRHPGQPAAGLPIT